MFHTSLRLILIILAVLFTAVQAIAINLGTAAPLPGILQRIAALPWWFVGLASLGLVVLAIIDWRWEQRQSSTRNIATGGGDYAEQTIDKRQGAFYAGGTHYHYGDPRATSPSALTPRLRTDLLAALATRYTQRIEDSLAVQARIALDLQTMPAAVAPQWRMHLHGPTPQRELLPGTPVRQVFDQANGELLILGAPGAGKTTLLLELACDLVARAQADGDHPIPVVVNLASWAQQAQKRERGNQQAQKLEQWLPEAIHTAAAVSTQVAKQLLTGRHLLLLLDGLDEVAEAKRAACIAAINAYCADQRPLRLVVCSRTAEYAAAGAQLELARAIEITPLTLPQVGAVLKGVPRARGVLVALRDDSLLRELLTTPLMLNITLLAYAGQMLPDVQARTLDERRAALFGAYARRMLQQRKPAPYSPRQIVGGLHWLAARMRQDAMTDFLLERMQRRWLPRLSLLRGYYGLHMLVYVVVYGGIGGSVGGVIGGLLFGIFAGLIGIFMAALITDPTPEMDEDWSEPRIYHLAYSLGSGTAAGLLFGFLVHGVLGGLIGMIDRGIAGGITGGLAFGLVGFLVYSLVTIRDVLRERRLIPLMRPPDVPNQRLRTSLHSGMLRTLTSGAIVGLGFGAVFGLHIGIRYAVIGVLVFGLSSGLRLHLQHYILRFLLARTGLLPWDAVGFLDTARDLLFLQRDGGIYRFRHILLRDYFASLTPEEVAALARGDDGVNG